MFDIIIEALFTLRRSGIAPANREDLQAVVKRIFDEAALGREIHDVEFVDLRRDHHDRTRENLCRARLILDHLAQIASIDYGARRDREILADLERTLSYLRGHAAIADRVIEKIPQPSKQTGPGALECMLERGRIPQQRVGRG